MTLFVILFFLLTICPASVFAAEPTDCDKYTKTAILQYREAKELGMAAPFPVWSDDYNHHYSWCTNQTSKSLEDGNSTRHAELEEFKKALVAKDSITTAPTMSKSGMPSGSVPPPVTLKPAPAGLVRVRAHISGHGQNVDATLQCPQGKEPVNWGWENIDSAQLWTLIGSFPMGQGRWRYQAATDPVYWASFPFDRNPDGKRGYGFNFYLYCDDLAAIPEATPGRYTKITADGVKTFFYSETK